MPDIFISYSSRDRDVVEPIRDALTAIGFETFWDQSVPAGIDWDTWIRRNLSDSKCALVLWSQNSTKSDNVRHEATIAKKQGKLVPILLEEIKPEAFPMGLYGVQAHNLIDWNGDTASEVWLALLREIEQRVSPLWIHSTIAELQKQLEAAAVREAELQRDNDRISSLLRARTIQLGERQNQLPPIEAQTSYIARNPSGLEPTIAKLPWRAFFINRLYLLGNILFAGVAIWLIVHLLMTYFPWLVKIQILIRVPN